MSQSKPPIATDDWSALRQFTAARIALGRAGASLPTAAMLEFQLAHASARDAVHLALDSEKIAADLHEIGIETLRVHSAAADRHVYLQRPDRGRQLDAPSRELLETQMQTSLLLTAPFDIAFVVADGLSALAIHRNAVTFLAPLAAHLRAQGWSIAPVVIAQQARVALGDDIGALLQAKIVVVLIGERPGLSSPDSMGIYLTWAPRPGLTDAARNCISNVREGGLSFAEAAFRLEYLLGEARTRQLSGVELKDETIAAPQLQHNARNFLVD